MYKLATFTLWAALFPAPASLAASIDVLPVKQIGLEMARDIAMRHRHGLDRGLPQGWLQRVRRRA